ncbi:MAG: stage 0 sporulation family protein [Oscillospiraceae bacterium]|nr:stage 0 sporulation family protein [Oscillospiraceae bacterium]
MTEIIGIRFRGGPKEYYFDPRGVSVRPGQYVVVETASGQEYARCVTGNREVEDDKIVPPLRPLLRIATEGDRRTWQANRTREKNAFLICQRKIVYHKLDMKLVKVEINFDGSKIIFFFTSDGRVDFRALVRDLASEFHARIELRQIGVRDEAKLLGGIGICGRPFCCAEFLDDFIPVSIKMAKTQNLSLNPTKISGTCGRLMCCLKYEQAAYEDAARRCPKQDSFVLTPDGPGNIVSVDILREQVTVRLDDMPESPKRYRNCELNVLRNGKGSREGIVVPRERPARYSEPEAETPAGRPAPYDGIAETADEDEGGKRRNRRGGRGRRKSAPDKQSAREDRPAKADKPARQERPVRQERPAKQDKPVAQEKPVKMERPVKADKPAKQDKPGEEKGAPRRRFYRGPRRRKGGGPKTEA